MRAPTKTALILLSALSLAAFAQTTPAPAARTGVATGEIAKLLPQLGIFMGPPEPCPVDCLIDVTVTRKPVQGVDSCVVQLTGEINIGKGKRTIAWRLVPTTIGDATYEFQEDYGILVIANKKKQAVQTSKGKDDATPAPGHFHLNHPNKSKGKGEIAYLPIVLQTTPDGTVTMCAAVDPKIVNDGE